ncbi:flagellar type III secretion system pore protein FliP [Haliovirga abyssi]|uniref:Flagellar biosynthetic protein FliP n=1 Tax=Haliovirga abyssi TaxID=2996794 RepID=A0AAU9D2A4_9FUSO|nr:flagellar type III secretion system pore protein FliP [Haliovirga abyssi]BDU50119.1 flagellar biosynthetic protein FliP [Haliovirga abyssi]
MKSKLKVLFFFIIISFSLYAEQKIAIPKFNFGIGASKSPDDLVTSLQILMGLTILTIAPSIIIMTTSFIRIIIVLHFVRQALGVQQMPPNQVLVGLALFLTFFIMEPTANDIMQNGINPYLNKKISQETLFKNIENPLKKFMLKQTRVKDLELFVKLSKTKKVKSRKDLSVWIVTPAYIISELTRGFEIGILIFIPFIIIDMIVATVLMSLGMMMLPPVMISIPFKLLLFVMVDGWNLIINSLVKSFN